MMRKLKERWQIKSNFQLAVIFVVFAINGSLSAKVGQLLLNLFGLNKENLNLIFYYLIFIVIVTLIYPFLLIANGFIFGQFEFFFRFSRRILKHLGLGFVFESKKNPD